ncbi:antioxidant, AhpC/TSA family [Treponema vincentii ATCC 35580]|jgi:thioredoxin|uniref:Antioxidant, AhpC/TSA family n=1 Tax=Treponema vincentii ATCC 35580 TaxID=596324 RepID=C8PSB1_9SPIR|nr:TlpA disulfide reductase family protein [Treponema vincentii]EEV19781.1 antioxidant, AhpC/TSA family [Treponema vincentii ATCC 35580]
MKVRILYVCLVFSLFVFGCSAKQTQSAASASTPEPETRQTAAASGVQVSTAQQSHTDSVSSLSSLGFYVYDTPIDLPISSSIPALAGDSIKVGAFTGKISLLNFWATWCPPCRAEMPSIERLHKQMSGTKFQIIAVNSGERRSQVASFIEKNKYTFPIYLDESNELSSIFAARGLPSTYLVNKEGKVIAARIGAMEYDQAELIKVLKELADG